MSDLYDSQLAGLIETIAADGGSFQWRGKTYNGIVDHVTRNITTLKSYFATAEAGAPPAYPKCGEPITVAARKFQITKKGNSEIKAVSGGFVDNPPFIDD